MHRCKTCLKVALLPWKAWIFLEQIPAKYDRIVVEYGNNDAATAWGISPESYKKDLSTILDAVGKAIVVGLCLPDPNNFEINQYYGEERLNLYNSIAKKSCS